jgi:hypothetical protein
MASEVFYSAIGDARLSAVLAKMFELKFADRGSIWGHPAIKYVGNAAGSGSTTIKTTIASLGGVDRMQAVAENASVSNTGLTLSSASITIGRQALQRSISDLAGMTDSNGINLQALVDDMYGAAAMRGMEMIVNQSDDFSSVVGTTTVDATIDDYFTAQFTLMNTPSSGVPICVLYPQQWSDIANTIRGESGSLQFSIDAANALKYNGLNYKGTLNGIDVFVSSLVPTANAGADSAGGMWLPGAIGYADGTPNQIVGAGGVVYNAGTKMFVEFERDASGALTKLVGNWYAGVGELQDGMGVSIVTDR